MSFGTLVMARAAYPTTWYSPPASPSETAAMIVFPRTDCSASLIAHRRGPRPVGSMRGHVSSTLTGTTGSSPPTPTTPARQGPHVIQLASVGAPGFWQPAVWTAHERSTMLIELAPGLFWSSVSVWVEPRHVVHGGLWPQA